MVDLSPKCPDCKVSIPLGAESHVCDPNVAVQHLRQAVGDMNQQNLRRARLWRNAGIFFGLIGIGFLLGHYVYVWLH